MNTVTQIMTSVAIAGSSLAVNATVASAEMACLPRDLTFSEHSQHIHVHTCDFLGIDIYRIGHVTDPIYLESGAKTNRHPTHSGSTTLVKNTAATAITGVSRLSEIDTDLNWNRHDHFDDGKSKVPRIRIQIQKN